VRPDTDADEKVALGESSKVAWADIFDTPLINDAWGNVSGFDEVAQPLGGVWVNFVVVGGHG
jgi:hypothetical protein